MLQTAENSSAELEPPGRGFGHVDQEPLHLPYAISEIKLPEDEEKRREFLIDRYAKFVHFSYRGEPTEETADLPDHKLQIAVDGIMHADHLVEAREDGKLVGLFAYRLLTRNTAPDFFDQLNAEYNPFRRRTKRQKVAQFHENIRAAIITEEQVVAPEKRGNSVGQMMRDKATEHLKGELVLALGQIQTRSSFSQRLKWHGATFYAGEVFNNHYLPEGFSEDEFRAYAHRLGRVYAREFNGANYDQHGIIVTDLFDVYTKFPSSLLKDDIWLKNPKETRAFRRIVDRQDTGGDKCSAIAVTLYRP